MPSSRYEVRNDSSYTVFVGWSDELGTFYAEVYASNPGGLQAQVGVTPLEIPTISQLQEAILRYVTLDPATVTALRHDAVALAADPHDVSRHRSADDSGSA